MLLMWTRPSQEQKGYAHAMHRIPPSEKIRNRIDELLAQGLDGEADVTTITARNPLEEGTWRAAYRVIGSFELTK